MLPALPSHLKNEQNSNNQTTKTIKQSTPIQTTTTKVLTLTGVKIPAGTKFHVKSTSKVSDWNGINTQVSFTTIAPFYKGMITIPSGAVFKGNIISARRPQITGNGGLLEIEINSLVYNGKSYSVEGKITKANGKNIFFNRIKGQRQYITGVKNKIKSANNFYKKARNLSNKLSSNPVGTILSPIPTITGWAGAFTGTALSPITGLIQKGKDISIPSGAEFELKLTKDAYLN